MKIKTSTTISSAHIVHTTDTKCNRLHGHNWDVHVEIDGSVMEDGMVVDFADIKGIIHELDHKLLIPKRIVKEEVEIDDQMYIRFIVQEKKYTIPTCDCEVIDLVAITAECLAEYLWTIISMEFGIRDMTVEVFESDKSSAIYDGVK